MHALNDVKCVKWKCGVSLSRCTSAARAGFLWYSHQTNWISFLYSFYASASSFLFHFKKMLLTRSVQSVTHMLSSSSRIVRTCVWWDTSLCHEMRREWISPPRWTRRHREPHLYVLQRIDLLSKSRNLAYRCELCVYAEICYLYGKMHANLGPAGEMDANYILIIMLVPRPNHTRTGKFP